MGRNFRVFVNRAAGSAGEADDGPTDIVDAFRALGDSATVTAVAPAGLADAMRAAWQPGVDAIVVAGGDGTINCAAGVAVELGIVLGVLPMGTFNHFAKDLGIPEELHAAVRFLSEAVVTAVDVGEVNGRIFVNNASIGVYPTMVADREALRKKHGWGKVRAAPLAILHTLRTLPVHDLQVALDQQPPYSLTTPFLFVGNGLFDDHGERMGKRTTLSDHRLGVYVIETTSRWRLVADAMKARVGGLDATNRVQRRTAETLVVDSPEPQLKIALDGEPTDLRVPLDFRSRPGAVRVLADPSKAGDNV